MTHKVIWNTIVVFTYLAISHYAIVLEPEQEMNHGNAAISIPQRALAIGVVSSAVLAGVTEPAYGITASEVIRSATNDPIVMFCGGCAAGALCAGLAVGFASRAHYRKRLESLMRDAKVENELDGTGDVRLRTNAAPKTSQRKVSHEGERAKRKQVERSVVTHDQPKVEESKAEAQPLGQTGKIGSEERREASRGVRSILLERLGTGVFDEPLVIDRGAEREARPTDFVQPSITGSFSPVGRAAIIDKRLPRFDESLFPDISTESSPVEEDDFELAMKAMERTMAQSVTVKPAQHVRTAKPAHAAQPAHYAQPAHAYQSPASTGSYRSQEKVASAQRPSFGEGKSFDVSSYVDYLINDEMELRSTSVATHYGRPHLTVFEGTGDLSGARAAAQRQAKQPKHFARATREA